MTRTTRGERDLLIAKGPWVCGFIEDIQRARKIISEEGFSGLFAANSGSALPRPAAGRC
jgi:hypothetical protein